MASNFEEDLMTCSICFSGYDEHLHKPKSLSCLHLFCLKCLKNMNPRDSLTCPLCREITTISPNGGAESLKNNPYPLQMIKMSQFLKSMDDASYEKQFRGPQWCLKCSNIAVPLCLAMDSHTTVVMGSSNRKEALVLQELKNKYETQLSTAIKKREETKSHLKALKNYLQIIEEDVKKQQEDNDKNLIQLNLLLKPRSTRETVQMVSNRLRESSAVIEQEIETANRVQLHCTNPKSWRVSIQLEDVEKKSVALVPEIERGFVLNEIQDRSNLNKGALSILTHIISSNLLKKTSPVTIGPVAVRPAATGTAQPVAVRPAAATAAPPVAVSPLTNKRFDAQTCIFAMKISQSGKLLGQVLIDPDLEFCEMFTGNLGNFCRQRQTFSAEISKAVCGSFVTMQFWNPNFQPYIPGATDNLFDSSWSEKEDALLSSDIFFGTYNDDGSDKITSWELGFLIKDYDENNMRLMPRFGWLRGGNKIMAALSKKRSQDRGNLSVTWEVVFNYYSKDDD